MGLHISFKHPFGKHSVLHQAGGIAKKLAPLAAFIPGVGPIAAGAIGALGGLAHHEGLGGALQGGLMGYAGGIAKDTLGGGDMLSNIGKTLKKPNILGNANGEFDISKLAGLGTGLANIAGARQQSKSAEKYNNANIDLRNQLMSRVLSGGADRKYDFTPSF